MRIGGIGSAAHSLAQFGRGIGLITDGVIGEAELVAQARKIGIETEGLLEELYGLAGFSGNQLATAREEVVGIRCRGLGERASGKCQENCEFQAGAYLDPASFSYSAS